MLADLTDAMRGQVVAGVRIHDAMAELKLGAENEPVVRVTLLMDDPRPGERTWPLSGIEAIERLVRRFAWERGIAEWVYVSHVPVNEADETEFSAESLVRARGRAR